MHTYSESQTDFCARSQAALACSPEIVSLLSQDEVNPRASTMNEASNAAPSIANAVKPAVAHDHDVVCAAQAGSPGALAELYALYSRRLYRTILAITRNPDDAEDALQDTFLRVCLALHTFEGRASFYSWITRIAVNSALLILRKRRARAEVLFDPQPEDQTEAFFPAIQDPALDPEQACDLHQRRMRVQRAIGNLDAHLRRPIQMQMMHDSSMKEIGRALNITEGAVKARLHRARLRISAACR
jgi:RNA polymerase sigma-70 factor (ECF subfamily)